MRGPNGNIPECAYLILLGDYEQAGASAQPLGYELVAFSDQDFSDYRPSDAVHNTVHYFYVAHRAMEDFDDTMHVIEFHGYGSDSLETIAAQCDTGGNPAVANLSETISDDEADEYTQYLGGSANTPARYTNGSTSVCTQTALLENNSHRYLHVEQSWAIRETAGMRKKMAAYIAELRWL